jgi:uncharacterized phage-associated protein
MSDMKARDPSATQRLILRIVSELEAGVYTMQLVKLIYLVDYIYYCQEGKTATGLSYIWDEYGPNASGHQIVKEANALAEAGAIDIRSAAGGDRARSHHLMNETPLDEFDPVLETIVEDVLRKYGTLPVRELVALSKETSPFVDARPGRPLVMKRSRPQMPPVTLEDWQRHLQERSAIGRTVRELKAEYGLD